MTRRLRLEAASICSLMIAAALAGCSEPKGPAFMIEGGGFIFNYRIAEVFYGVSVKPLRKLEPGSVIVAEFENPAGGAALIVRETIAAHRVSYGLRSPAVDGVKADRPYRVVVTALSPAGVALGRIERTFKSDLDQEVNPEKPLTFGPGYTRNPEAAETKRAAPIAPQ